MDNGVANLAAALPSVQLAESTPAGLTAIQWLICAIACLGFTFDLYEGLMLPLIVRPVLFDLGHLSPGARDFNLWVGLLFFVPTAIGGAFGLVGGYLSDLLGRRRVLVWSILLYTISACAASFSTSIPEFMFFRCTTLIGVSVEFVAGITWIAELFPAPEQRNSVLGYTQAFYNLGGFLVAGAYYLSVTHAEQLPSIWATHQPWRYTLFSGLIPAIPLMLVRPFLPESQVWREKKRLGTLKRPSFSALFQPALKKQTWTVTVLVACSFVLAYGAMQQTVRIVPGLPGLAHAGVRYVEQTVSRVQLLQELGGVTGRILFVLLILRIAKQRTRLLLFLTAAFVVYGWMYFYGATQSILQLQVGMVLAALVFNGLYSFWGNYLPTVFPTHLRGTGEGFAFNIGGKILGASAALVTTQLANVMPAADAGHRLAYSAGLVATVACLIGVIVAFWLREPESDLLPA
ncbi:MAG: MFS transporter [Acidobacteriaceae bacterium]